MSSDGWVHSTECTPVSVSSIPRAQVEICALDLRCRQGKGSEGPGQARNAPVSPSCVPVFPASSALPPPAAPALACQSLQRP